MSKAVLFVDRDGTLIEEPHDNQVDSLTKVRFMPGVLPALGELTSRGYRLVMVTNQTGLGTPDFPFPAFIAPHEFMLNVFASQGIRFDEVFVCPHRPIDDCACRKPKPGLLKEYLREHSIDLEKSAVIGDRDTDLELAANIGVRGLRVGRGGAPEHTWPKVVQALLARQALIVRHTRETHVQVGVNLDAREPVSAKTGIGFFDHMLEALATHGGFALELSCLGDLKVDEHHTVEDCALVLGEAIGQALGDKRGIGRYGFVLPMDDAQVDVAIDLSGRPFSLFSGRFNRDVVGALPTELVPHFFRSLSDSLQATLHVSVRGENTHHMVEACFKGVGRALRQAIRLEDREVPSTKGIL
jgi:imidazoleglycerol-phosphate dehydratase/histidinol-phosphatase